MTRITDKFDQLKQAGKKGFIAYITAGDPSIEVTEEIVLRLEDEGVDLIELGVPFSDPLADGGVNQAAATRALQAGTTPEQVYDAVHRVRERSEIPIILYTYLNLLLPKGFTKTLKGIRKKGSDGALVLDLPVEELEPYREGFLQSGIDNIRLVTPTSPDERIKSIVKDASGFVYCVSRSGVTGMQKNLGNEAADVLSRTRKATDLPIALGFGISTPAQARAAAQAPDAVVVGSAIVDRFHRAPQTKRGRKEAAAWVGTLVRAVKEV